MKPAIFLKGSRKALQNFPDQARKDAGSELYAVQQGKLPHDWKPMPSVGPGAVEIRIHDHNEYRVIYVAKFAEAIYVLSAFEKKTQKTPQREIEIARSAYAEIEDYHKS
jgi:phage-related protein